MSRGDAVADFIAKSEVVGQGEFCEYQGLLWMAVARELDFVNPP